MTDTNNKLLEQIREISLIIDRVEKSRFDYLELQIGDLRVCIGHPPARQAAPQERSFAMTAQAGLLAPPVATSTPNPAQPAPAAQDRGADPGGEGVPVRSPMIGRFYARPEPGADPFVEVGALVTADTTVGLIEVMKVFNAVAAGVAGTVTGVAVADGEFVEFDQPLLYVKPPA
ncbi:acetyl-CoA carboxylase biotin carboxyl carrier protein subunit [Ramlibacter sp. AW1]|uniref:Biotin carboxyl carrier protein of acetyl-CoA carboxylase n=1 Tax=Ramlibacter aurantiacus TaxID=2801330 RepID=A0A936ZZQ4_9BURK|nr:biotin/lipoyl-containing protein [Ramlibacter aurantiacus]MBL0423419.1 acetyl-CoA carboxylase biotin carboxyl carrier protein subunit [Ramlibacter aurantiacus]